MLKSVRESFKENDWIVLTDSIGQQTYLFVEQLYQDGEQLCIVMDCEIYNLDGLYFKDCSLEVWKPEFNEWCCFFNHNADSFRVSRFKQIAWGKKRQGLYKDMKSNYYECCEPWRGEFPYQLRDKLLLS